MRIFALFALLYSTLFSLELSFQSGKRDAHPYSLLYLSENKPFTCQPFFDDFHDVRRIVCQFEKGSVAQIAPIKNSFFTVTPMQSRAHFELEISSAHYLKLVPIYFNLQSQRELVDTTAFASSRYVIIGYDHKPFVLGKRSKMSENSINFPITFKEEPLPTVGSLDLKGNPVELSSIKDVNGYLEIKTLYENQKYNEVLKAINLLLEQFPKTIFKAEMLLYQIRCFQKLLESENVIESGKKFLRFYSFDENTPEVLSIMGQAYGIIGMNADADYFFDRLFSDYPDSAFVAQAYIFKAEQLETNGQAKKAITYYEKAMFEAKQKDVASLAALRISEYYINLAKKEQAKRYLYKVLDANPGYFHKSVTLSIKLAKSFAERHEYVEAAKIAEALLATMNTSDDEYENIMRQVALWHYENSDANATAKAVDRYLQTYKYGEYREELQTLKEQLFFDVDESNVTKALAYYDNLIESYPNTPTQTKAYFKKAALLFNKEQYDAVLEMNATLHDIDAEQSEALMQRTALRAMQQALTQQLCDQALHYFTTYNIDATDDAKALFSCALKRLDLKSATALYARYHSENASSVQFWLDGALVMAEAKRDYKGVIALTQDLEALAGARYKELLRKRFDAANMLKDDALMIKTIKQIEALYGLKEQDIERYMQMVHLGVKTKENTLIGIYSPKVNTLITRSNNTLFSPEFEFIYAQYLVNANERNRAIDLLKRLYTVAMKPEDAARFYYTIGALYEANGSTAAAKEEYRQAIEQKADSSWAMLSKDALKLLQ